MGLLMEHDVYGMSSSLCDFNEADGNVLWSAPISHSMVHTHNLYGSCTLSRYIQTVQLQARNPIWYIRHPISNPKLIHKPTTVCHWISHSDVTPFVTSQMPKSGAVCTVAEPYFPLKCPVIPAKICFKQICSMGKLLWGQDYPYWS